MAAEPNAQGSGDSRRRSMLPQKSSTNPSSTRMLALTEHEPEEKSVPAAKVKASKNASALRDDSSSMLPPSTLGRTRSSRDTPSLRQSSRPSSATSSRRSSMAKASAPDPMKTLARPRHSCDAKASTTANRVTSHGRSVSQQVVPTSASRLSSLPSMTRVLRQSSLKPPRPAFSTMQQHYSPKKPTLTSNSRRPMAKETDQDQAAVDVFPLQIELTQLHLIHRSAAKVQKDWERSAKGFFQSRFDDLCARHVELKEIAHQQQTLLNQLALVEWCQGKPSNHVAEKVQQLSRHMADISSLLHSEGKYTRILEVFQSWFDQAECIQKLRSSGAETNRRDITFIEGIGDGWKAESMVLERELTYSLREINGFGKVRGESSLGHILKLQKKLVSNLLDELDVIQWIEHDMMVKESSWMEDAINRLSSNVSNDVAG